MPVVRNTKSRARDFYDGTRKGRVRRASPSCSWFVLYLGIAMGTAVGVEFDLKTVICQERSVSRESVAGTQLQPPADASLTIWWRQFEQA
jgi:hypothetical protein